ncbi:protein STRUBBELIG-RECEPTOR FAMILY 2-like isoform X2 [Asparagus officinalis]|uniref:protein STRUBBELIG-RECEPTOR FAMILY 2-like isoform X2 n=1 Tax=Asparagus officinalis TaxID=4686 RepID=UPI00098E7F42|nr:protein STRUBBELIG-RECEPTOR FAMILY 2-like isoform X2 [Asparagus officinalis]
MMVRFDQILLLTLLLFFGNSLLAFSVTDPMDLSALEALYKSLNSPTQLIGWKSRGGDPCGNYPWTGVLCSHHSVVSINIKGLGLDGSLDSQISSLLSLKELDVSYNSIGGEIPHSLPPNATYIDLAVNNFNSSIPHPIPSLKVLSYLNVSYNSLTGPMGNVFTNMQDLEQLDLSFNHFVGDLPSSFGSLAKLHTLHLENNDLTGSVVYLQDLPLTVLNLQNNHFSGYVPKQFESIPSLRIDGNLFQPGFKGPPSSVNVSTESHHSPAVVKISQGHNFTSSSLFWRLCLGIPAGCISVVLLAALLIHIHASCEGNLERPKISDASFHVLPVSAPRVSKVKFDTSVTSTSLPSVYNLKPERDSRRKSRSQSFKNLDTPKLFSALELLEATNNYSEDNVIGEGSNGRVYRAEFPDGQILAVKKINMVALAAHEEEEFQNVLWNLFCLRHQNINTLFGYSVEQGEHILVYDYARNGSLDGFLFSANDKHRALSWKARVAIALDVARALEFMHCVCSPPIAHGNLKASNILLDDELTPYISDCGLTVLWNLVDSEPKQAGEEPISSNGYAAPELSVPGADMTKCDTYSYGVVLLELLTGRRAFDSSKIEEEQLLVKWAFSRLHDSSSLEGMVDPAIRGTFPSKILSRFADIILLCIQVEPEFRPPVTVIAESLTSLIQKMAHPHRHSNRKRSSVDASKLNIMPDMSFRSTLPYFDQPSSTISD